MVDQMTWVPESVHRRSVGVLRGWVIALAAVVLIALLGFGGLFFRALFATPSAPVVVSSPRDCRIGGDAQHPKLYVAVDVAMIVGGSLARASSLGPSGWDVEAVGVRASLAPLSTLGDADLARIAASAVEDSKRLDEDNPRGVVVAILDTDGQVSGHLNGIRTLWVQGEPASEQDLALGIDFTPTSCTVTTAR